MADQTKITFDEVLRALDRARIEVEFSRRAEFQRFAVDPTCAWPASRVFHDHSRLGPHWRPELSVRQVEALTTDGGYRRYEGAPLVALPVTKQLDLSFEQVLRARRSTSEFAQRPVELGAVAKILTLSCGVTDSTGDVLRRACPSGGALYPIETYLFGWHVPGLRDGLYHYVAIENALEHLCDLVDRDVLSSALPPSLLEGKPPIVFVLSAVFARTQAKYLERGYRFALLEAGHIAQNISLVATALGLGAVTVGGFWDDPLNEIFGFEPTEEAALYCVLVGHPRSVTRESPR